MLKLDRVRSRRAAVRRRADVLRGLLAKESRQLTDSIAGMRPMARRRRGVRRLGSVSTAALAAVGLAAVGGLLLWDDRRRAAMRQRLTAVTSSMGASVGSAAEAARAAAQT
jgi:hypothetical protein